MSVFFVKLCLVTIGTEQDVWHPVRGSTHLFADNFKIDAGIAFDDQFIMNVSDDESVPESFHGVAAISARLEDTYCVPAEKIVEIREIFDWKEIFEH